MPPAASRIPGKYLANYLCFEGDGEAAGGPGKLSLVLDEIERLLVEREVKELSLPVYDEQRKNASTGAVCTDTRNLL